MTKPLTLPWRQIASWIIANALILQLVLSPMVMLPRGGFDAAQDGAITFALCTHGDESGKLPADGKDATCQLCLTCSFASLLPDPSRVPVASSDHLPAQWSGLAVAVPRSKRLAQERSRGPPRMA